MLGSVVKFKRVISSHSASHGVAITSKSTTQPTPRLPPFFVLSFKLNIPVLTLQSTTRQASLYDLASIAFATWADTSAFPLPLLRLTSGAATTITKSRSPSLTTSPRPRSHPKALSWPRRRRPSRSRSTHFPSQTYPPNSSRKPSPPRPSGATTLSSSPRRARRGLPAGTTLASAVSQRASTRPGSRASVARSSRRRSSPRARASVSRSS